MTTQFPSPTTNAKKVQVPHSLHFGVSALMMSLLFALFNHGSSVMDSGLSILCGGIAFGSSVHLILKSGSWWLKASGIIMLVCASYLTIMGLWYVA